MHARGCQNAIEEGGHVIGWWKSDVVLGGGKCGDSMPYGRIEAIGMQAKVEIFAKYTLLLTCYRQYYSTNKSN